MMKNIITKPGFGLNEYLLVLHPHEELRNKIIHVKKEFYDKYQSSANWFSKPHITLVSFSQYEGAEERIKNRLHVIAMGHKPAKIELKNFGSFPSHSIFIQVTSKLPVQTLVKKIRTEAQKLMKADSNHKPFFIMEPYVPVASKLLPWQYEKGWLEYSNRQFTGRLSQMRCCY